MDNWMYNLMVIQIYKMVILSKEHREEISRMNKGNKHGCNPWTFQMMSIMEPIRPYVLVFKELYANNRQLIKKHWQHELALGRTPKITDLFDIEVKIRAKHSQVVISNSLEIRSK